MADFLPLLFITKGNIPKYLMLHQVHYFSLIHKQKKTKKKEFQTLLYFTTKPTSLAFKQI